MHTFHAVMNQLMRPIERTRSIAVISTSPIWTYTIDGKSHAIPLSSMDCDWLQREWLAFEKLLVRLHGGPNGVVASDEEIERRKRWASTWQQRFETEMSR